MANRPSTPALPTSDQSNSSDTSPSGIELDIAIEMLRRMEEEETRRGGKEGKEERLRKSLYTPSEELLALAGRFIGAAMNVHSHLGAGYPEVIYHRALCRELERRGIPYDSEVLLDVVFKNEIVGQFRLDLVIDKKIVVELKAVDYLTDVHKAQAVSYLRAYGVRYGLVINFNVVHLYQGLKRVVWSR